MKKNRLFILFFCAATLSAEISRLPDEFFIRERIFSLTATFDLETDIGPFAVARKRFFAWTPTFDIEDSFQNTLATATSRLFSWGTVADVVDPQNNTIGWIEETLFPLLSWSEYKVFNDTNQLVAIATMNLFGTEFELHHPDSSHIVYATISRPYLRFFQDLWTVTIKDRPFFETGCLDPRLLIVLAIYQTNEDNRRRIQKDSMDRLLNDDDRRFVEEEF